MKSIMQNYFYLIIGMAIGGMITLLLPSVNAQTIVNVCIKGDIGDRNINQVLECIESYNDFQDKRLSLNEEIIISMEERISVVENNTRSDTK